MEVPYDAVGSVREAGGHVTVEVPHSYDRDTDLPHEVPLACRCGHPLVHRLHPHIAVGRGHGVCQCGQPYDWPGHITAETP